MGCGASSHQISPVQENEPKAEHDTTTNELRLIVAEQKVEIENLNRENKKLAAQIESRKQQPMERQGDEKIKAQVEAGFRRRNIEFVKSTFESHKDIAKNLILASSLGSALSCLDVHVEATEIDEVLKSRDLNGDGGLNFQEFSSLVSSPSPVEEWVGELRLNQLVADAMPREDGLVKEQLRCLSKTTLEQLEVSCEIIKKVLLEILQKGLASLKESFEKLDSQAAVTNNSKYQISKMSAGNISNFHDGLACRIGD
jgi:hypothetical protein